jgi:glyoxylase-like metal-dependent hydrolase (beta-lactamase superfamily II)
MTEVATGVRRAGSALVNWYLVEDGGKVTLVDAGVPGYWPQLDEALAAMGRSRSDVEALVLTHGDGDHVGFAERLRRETGARVLVHGEDVELTTTRKQKKTESGLGTLAEFRHGAAWRILWEIARNGGLRVPPVAEVETFSDGDVLDVPGRPRVVHTPGHTHGHCVVHLPDRGVVFAGDAMCTLNVLRGTPGPQLMPPALTVNTAQALASLDKIAALGADTVLVGHGEPWTEGSAAAVERARAVAAAGSAAD